MRESASDKSRCAAPVPPRGEGMLRGVCRSRTVHHDRRRSSPVGLASALTSAGRSHPRNAPRAVRPHRTPVHGYARVGVLMVRQAIERAGVRGVAVGPFRETGAAWERRPIGTKITGVSRAQRSASRRRVVRCRPGIVTHTTFVKVPEQRRTASLRSRCTASGTRNVLSLSAYGAATSLARGPDQGYLPPFSALLPSSSGPGRRPLTAKTGVRVP